MDESKFSSTVSGTIRWADNGCYCYFHPNPLPLGFSIEEGSRQLLDSAIYKLGKLDGKASQLSAEERSVVSMAFTMKESALSSAIEGTGTTMADLYRSQRVAELDSLKAADNREVNNYKDALEQSDAFDHRDIVVSDLLDLTVF